MPCQYPGTYKSYFLCSDVVMDAVSCPVVTRVETFAWTFALGVARVVADKSGTADQEVEQEAQHLHADGDEEEDERVPPLVSDQQLGEDAREGDDHPRRAWKQAGEREMEELRRVGEREEGKCGFGLTLSGHHPLRVPLGQHPHVTIETGLLHWGGMKKRFSSGYTYQHGQSGICLERAVQESSSHLWTSVYNW